MIRFYKKAGAAALAAGLIFAPTASFAGVFIGIGISVNVAPPVLPVYQEPPCPAPDLIWTPGYWAYADYGGYYWVPGAWVEAPQVGYLWTPGYWGYGGGAYAWHPGYWGRHVGFYGGVNYGYGYFGSGFFGGGWNGEHFRYNTAYANVNRTVINNTYVNRNVINNNYTHSRVSYNGGPRGISARPTSRELAFGNEARMPATTFQRDHIENAARTRTELASVNHGRPPEAAITTPFGRENRSVENGYRGPAHAGAARVDAFSRFDRNPQSHGYATTRDAYGAPAIDRANAPYRSPSTYRQGTYHPPSAYASQRTYRANAYHATDADHAPTAYHASSAYHAQAAYRTPAYHGHSANRQFGSARSQDVTHLSHGDEGHGAQHRER